MLIKKWLRTTSFCPPVQIRKFQKWKITSWKLKVRQTRALRPAMRKTRAAYADDPLADEEWLELYPLLPSLLLFAFTFTVKRYGMKHYPFLFASNIATTENNTFLRHGFTSDGSHNLRNSVGVLRHELHSTHSFRQAHQLGNGTFHFLSGVPSPPKINFAKQHSTLSNNF